MVFYDWAKDSCKGYQKSDPPEVPPGYATIDELGYEDFAKTFYLGVVEGKIKKSQRQLRAIGDDPEEELSKFIGFTKFNLENSLEELIDINQFLNWFDKKIATFPREDALKTQFGIKIKTLMGYEVPLLVSRQNTVLELKAMYRQKEGIPENQQRIVFKGAQLEDEDLLEHYNIKRNDTLHMILMLRGGMFHVTSGSGEEIQTTTTAMFEGVPPCREKDFGIYKETTEEDIIDTYYKMLIQDGFPFLPTNLKAEFFSERKFVLINKK